MSTLLLIDTDVLINYLREQEQAVAYLESLTEEALISAVTVAELYAGVREGKERKVLDAFIRAFEVVPVDAETLIPEQGDSIEKAQNHRTHLA